MGNSTRSLALRSGLTLVAQRRGQAEKGGTVSRPVGLTQVDICIYLTVSYRRPWAPARLIDVSFCSVLLEGCVKHEVLQPGLAWDMELSRSGQGRAVSSHSRAVQRYLPVASSCECGSSTERSAVEYQMEDSGARAAQARPCLGASLASGFWLW